ncbi:MAG TPA: hypothetical protein VGS27_16280 [Candidatus Sulfotelmatobacter sp.]|nr:hypothetical protein [Candidatus Sulfotelmatobacter sp.]
MNASARPGAATPGRSGAGNFTSHQAIADGNWHSFGGTRGTTQMASVNHVGLVGGAWHGGVWGGGFRGGYGAGWGRPGWNWGWGGGWGWGFGGWGWGGWGLGFGWGWGWGWGGWGLGWDPFWAWPPYYYNPWLYAYNPAPDVIYPYPD